MSALSVLAQDDGSSTETLDRSAARPRGKPRGQAPAAISGAVNEPQRPNVVLQLPDLATPGRSRRSEQFRYASQIYWVAIALGALLALWLVMSGKKSPDRSAEEAPAWSPSAVTQAPPLDRAGPSTSQNAAPVFTARSLDAAGPAPPSTVKPSEAAPLGIGPGVIQ